MTTPIPFSGGPDYGVPRYRQAVPSPDPTDVPARLDGYGRVDNLGRIIVHDDFGQGLARWHGAQTGTGIAPAITTVAGNVFVPPNAVLFDASAAVNDVSYLYLFMNVRRSDRLGLESMWLLEPKPLQLEHVIEYALLAGVAKKGSILLDPVTNKVKIAVPAGFQDVMDFDCSALAAGEFVPFKLVVDFTTGKYVRAIVGGTLIDLSAYDLKAGTYVETYRLTATIYVTRTHATLTLIKPNLGYLTLTFDEP